ncbi:MAG TPA: SpoIIE family protein phosphatase, partial [Vicinamibacterales bacterium]
MSLRLRLIVAFFLFSVVPLAAVTFYSYTSNLRALQVAAQHETEMLTSELTQRMQVVTSQISERVQHLMDMPAASSTMTATGTSGKRATQARTAVARSSAAPRHAAGPTPALPAAAAAAVPAPAADPNAVEVEVAGALGEVAMLLNNVEVRGMGRFGGPRPPDVAVLSPAPGSATAPHRPFPPDRPEPRSAYERDSGGRRGPPRHRTDTPAPAATRDEAAVPGAQGTQSPGPPPPGPGLAPSGPPPPSGSPPPPGSSPSPGPSDASSSDPSRMKLDLAPIRRELFHEMAPDGSFDKMTPEERQRIGREVNQRLLGIVQGIQLGAAELQKKADAAQRQATATTAQTASARSSSTATSPAVPIPGAATPSAIAPPAPVPPPSAPLAQSTRLARSAAKPVPRTPSAKPVTRRAALTGTNLAVSDERNGQVVQQVNAEINLPNLLATVFANTRRDSGEIPFAVGKDSRLYAPTDADRAKLADLDVVHIAAGTTRLDNWIVATLPDQSGAGLRFGIARPVGNLLNDLRRTTARNAGFGLLFIAIAVTAMVPLSSRLTRNLTVLTEGVGRIATGDYAARVPVRAHDEIGRLAEAFNRMAADVEQHQRSAIEQERIRRELELGRLIQHEMLPHAPLHLGLTEVKGVSVPAREVGGDFFNYFQLDSGPVALLVGDVSGKGVGAALLMANIQASLRTRFALGQELSAIAEAIDRDIEANTPGPVYATLFIAILDPATRRMRYVNAGHNPQFVLRGDGRLEKMSSTGLPV